MFALKKSIKNRKMLRLNRLVSGKVEVNSTFDVMSEDRLQLGGLVRWSGPDEISSGCRVH